MTLLLALACHSDSPPAGPKGDDDDDSSPVDTSTPGDSGPVDTGTPPPPIAVSGLTWRLHDAFGSIAYAEWDQAVDGVVHVEYEVDPGEWRSTPSFDAVAGHQTQIVVGIPYEWDVEWRVVLEAGGDPVDGPTIHTGSLPGELPAPRLVADDPTGYDPAQAFLLTSVNGDPGGWTGGDYFALILDRQARIVWAQPTPGNAWCTFPQIAVTGDSILWDEQTYWSEFGEGEDSKVHHVYLDAEIEVVSTPGLHHPFTQKPDGTLVWGSQAHGGGEALVEKAPGQVDETVIWTCTTDWSGAGCESNGLFYDVLTDTYLYSFYTNDTVVSVSRTDDTPDATPGSSRWWAGGLSGGFAFDPPNKQYSWQHGVSYTDARTLLLSSELDGHTWVLEYEVDEAAGVLRYVWGSDSGTYADTNGQAWRLANGNTLHLVGAAGVIREVTPDDVDVWRLTWGGTNLVGQGQFIEDLYALVSPAP